MAEVKKYIAVDLGAESGRVILGSVSAEKITLEEIHRFSNGPIEDNGSLRWDFNRLLGEIKAGIAKAAKAAPFCAASSISWQALSVEASRSK